MKLPFITTLVIALLLISVQITAQPKRSTTASKPATQTPTRSPEIGQTAIVIDETLSVLRKSPSLYSESVHRMQRGRKVQILGVVKADGVSFCKVTVPPKNFGWVQAEAVFGKFRAGDELRLAELTQAADGFDKVEIATYFFDLYPDSKVRAALLLNFGDVIEQVAARLSRDAASRLSRMEMAASRAPLHSYYLNFNMLDRYRKLGIIFLFNPATRQYHYDGARWKEIVDKFPDSDEAVEARRRLDSLKEKLAQTSTK